MTGHLLKNLPARLAAAGMILLSPWCLAGEDLKPILQQHYIDFIEARTSGEYSLPFSMESVNNSSNSSARIRYFLDAVDLDVFAGRLQQPAEWCEFIPLHLNIKACAFLEQGNQTLLQFYAGIKGYVTPDNAHLLQLAFTAKFSDDIFIANLFAADGPLDSTDINFDIRAIAIDDNDRQGIYLEFDLTSVPGLAAGLMRVYLATIARKKIGFSVEKISWSGKPQYVTGSRGALERNLVRYLLAIETYFATLELPADTQFRNRLETWFDATEQYPDQLHELERAEYIDNKFRERINQGILQQAIVNKVDPVFKPVDRNR